MIVSGEAGLTRYDAANPVFSAMTRLDRDVRLGVTYGVPLGSLADDLPPEVADLVISASAEYVRQLSDLPNYTTANVRTGLTLTKRWGF